MYLRLYQDVFRRQGRLWHRVFLRVADGRHADRGARILRSRQGGGLARHSSRRSNAEGEARASQWRDVA